MFRKNRSDGDDEWEGRYWEELQRKKVPLLTLDSRWHQLFPEHKKSKELQKKEEALQKLIKKQGQTNEDLKEYRKAKRVIMENILNNMTDGHQPDSPLRSKKQDSNQKLLDELKGKIEDAERVKHELPGEIRDANQELLLQSMKECYQTLVENTRGIRFEEEWIQRTRSELTEHILQKQEMEMRNIETYKFMHDLLGADLLELFDREYDVWKGEEE